MKSYIALGSNMGNLEDNLSNAISALSNSSINVVSIATPIITKAYGVTDQADFLNTVIEIETEHEPHQLLDVLNKIEAELGRVREKKWGPRIIDLDIIFYEDRVIDDERLSIPHYDLENRDFVLVPLFEIAPTFVNPRNGKTVSQMLKQLESKF